MNPASLKLAFSQTSLRARSRQPSYQLLITLIEVYHCQLLPWFIGLLKIALPYEFTPRKSHSDRAKLTRIFATYDTGSELLTEMSGRGGYHGPRTHDSPGGVGASPSRGRGGRGGAAGHSTGNSSSSPFCSWREPAAPEGSPGAGAFGSLQGGRGGRGRGGGGGRGRGGHTSRGGHHNCNSGRGGGGGRGRGRGRGASAAAAAPVAMRRDRPYRPGDEFIRPDAAISSDEEYHVIDEGVLAEFGMRDVDFNRADSSGAGSGDTTDDDNAIDERFADDLAALQAELGAEDHSELDDEGKDYNIYGEEDDGEEEEDSEDDDDLDEELLAAIGAAPAPSASLDRFITAAAVVEAVQTARANRRRISKTLSQNLPLLLRQPLLLLLRRQRLASRRLSASMPLRRHRHQLLQLRRRFLRLPGASAAALMAAEVPLAVAAMAVQMQLLPLPQLHDQHHPPRRLLQR